MAIKNTAFYIPASPNVQAQWRDRVAAEYASSAIAAQLLHWLIQIGVSPDLLFKCQEVVREELMHTDLSREVYLHAGGKESLIEVNPSHLYIPHASQRELLYRAMEFTADFFCVGETVAAPLFQKMVEGVEVPVARKSLLRIVKDEEGHGEFGWVLLEHLLAASSQDQREDLKKRVPNFVNRILSSYKSASIISADDTKWGVISGKDLTDISGHVAESILLPNFKNLL